MLNYIRILLALTVALLVGCDSVNVEEGIAGGNSETRQYTGPDPATADVQSFKANLWDNLIDKCGNCHGTGGQSPTFVRDDDINLAYSDAISLVDLASAEDSRLVTKVAAGHNCWEASTNACAAIMTAFIENWGGNGGESETRTVELIAPQLKDAGDSRSYPDDSSSFASTIYPVLRDYCVDCHAEDAQIPQSPYFSSADVDAAYEATKLSQKLDLDNPANSRLVIRLRSEFHNCWDDCDDNADEMETAISNFANGITPTEVDSALVLSKALTLADGTIASGGSRHEENVIALYEFKEGEGNTIYDVSGITPLMHLELAGTKDLDYKWVGGWGVEFVDSIARATTSSSRKLADFIKASGEYSLEAWVVPGNVTQEGPARIISYSAGVNDRNFMLGQTLYNYDFLNRSSSTDANGDPRLSTADADEVLQATEQHVVVTFDPVNGRSIYVNGEHTGDVDSDEAGNLSDWDETFAFVLGNEVTNDRTWQGKLRLVAVHNRALLPEQIQQNYEAGVGEKFFLLFNVADVVDVPESYVMFEVSQFDSYSYLFSQPNFISLDMEAVPDDIVMQGMRIGINGREAAVGQAYANLDTTITADQFVASELYNAKAQSLSNLGTIIPLEKGTDDDEFFLTFERLADQSNVFVEATPVAPAPTSDTEAKSDVGLRLFDEINASMAQVTGVAVNQSDVQATYETIKQQMPSTENIEGFLSAHQVAISQLAIEYCNALVEDTNLRASFFPDFNFSQAANVAFDASGKSQVISPLLDNIIGSGLSTQPDSAAVESELGNLIDRLTACGGSCEADRTETVVKASCAAVLGSAAMLIQ